MNSIIVRLNAGGPAWERDNAHSIVLSNFLNDWNSIITTIQNNI